MSMTDVFESMTAREAARIVLQDGADVDIGDLAASVRQVSLRCSKRVVSMTESGQVKETVRAKHIERTILEAAKEAVAAAVGLKRKQRSEQEGFLHRAKSLAVR